MMPVRGLTPRKLMTALVLAVALAAQVSYAQSVFKVTVRDQKTNEPVAGATVTVKGTGDAATTDAQGVASLAGIPDGEQTVTVFFPGYEPAELKVTFPAANGGEHLIFIKVTNELGEVTVVETTRTGREIDDTPTRVEVIDEEEVASVQRRKGRRVRHPRRGGLVPPVFRAERLGAQHHHPPARPRPRRRPAPRRTAEPRLLHAPD